MQREENNNFNGDEAEKKQAVGSKNLVGALVAAILSAIFFGLTFSPLQIYSLICSTLLAIISLWFLSKQKKQGKVKYYTAVNVFAYVMLFICVATFVGGIIYSATLT